MNQVKEKIKERQEFIYDNLFSILNIETDEMSHSKIIAYLLAPDGKFSSGQNELTCRHNFGTKFLRSFLEKPKLGIKNEVLDNLDKTETKVIVEYVPNNNESNRRMDIFIKIGTFALVIENKIYADDQQEQLYDYYNFLKEDNDITEFRLVYLTLDGKDPSKNSKKDLTSDQYIRLSYKDDIKPWLKECNSSATSTSLEKIISSYLQILGKIFYYDELSNLILKAGCDINDIAEEIKNSDVDVNKLENCLFDKQLRQTVMPVLKEKYSKYNFEVTTEDLVCRVYLGEENNNVKILYEFRKRDTSVGNAYGIHYDKKIDKDYLKKIQDPCIRKIDAGWWIKRWTMKTSWNFCDSSFFNNFNENNFKEYINDAAAKIDNYIKEKGIKI